MRWIFSVPLWSNWSWHFDIFVGFWYEPPKQCEGCTEIQKQLDEEEERQRKEDKERIISF